jgi:hypothetical protein
MTTTPPYDRTAHRAAGTATAHSLAVAPVPGGVAITGPVADVAALLGHLHATGATVTPSPARDRINVTLPATPATTATGTAFRRGRVRRVLSSLEWRHLRTAGICLAVLTGLSLAAATAWLIYLAVVWVAAHLAVIGAVLLAVVVLAAAAGTTTGCTTTVRVTHRH